MEGFYPGRSGSWYDDPAHWSKQRRQLDLNVTASFVKREWNIGGRLDHDAA